MAYIKDGCHGGTSVSGRRANTRRQKDKYPDPQLLAPGFREFKSLYCTLAVGAVWRNPGPERDAMDFVLKHGARYHYDCAPRKVFEEPYVGVLWLVKVQPARINTPV